MQAGIRLCGVAGRTAVCSASGVLAGPSYRFRPQFSKWRIDKMANNSPRRAGFSEDSRRGNTDLRGEGAGSRRGTGGDGGAEVIHLKG